MSKVLLGLLLLALPSAASALTGGECLDGAAAYELKPTLPELKRLMPCLDDPDPRVRAALFDKLLHREVWDDPGFKALRPALMAAARKGQRDPDVGVSGKADGMVWWLQNSEQYDQERARAAQAAQQAAGEAAESASVLPRVRLSLIFGAGVVAETLILVLSGGGNPRTLLLAALVGVLGLLPGKNENHYDLYFHVALCFVVFAFTAFCIYKKEIMAHVSESSLLVNSLTLWYLCMAFLGGSGRWLVMGLAALPTLGTLIVAFTLREWSFKAKLACYVWFLLLTAANTCFQVGFGNFGFLFSRDFRPNPIDLFMTGMAFTLLASSLFYVYILIPIQGKHETKEHRMKQWREDAHAMAGCFADYRLTAPQALQIVGLQLGFYGVNHWAHFMLPRMAMNVSMVLLPLGVRMLYGGSEAAPAPAVDVEQHPVAR